MKRGERARTFMAVALCLGLSPAALGRTQDVAPPDWSDERKEEFLLNAEISVLRQIDIGRNRTRRAEMDDGETQHDGHVQIVDDFMARFEGERGVELNFTDSYKYNIAAYRLDRLLGLNMIPVSVERTVAGDRAAVTWWVDDVQMTMVEFTEDELTAPDILDWINQMMHIRLFNELVYNVDPNLGNFVITDDWKVWMVDFTRAFRINETLRSPENIENIRINRQFFDGMVALDFDTLDQVMEDFLNDTQIRALLARRDVLVEELEAQMALRGEAGVIAD